MSATLTPDLEAALAACSAPVVIIQAIAGGAGLVVPQQQDKQP